MKYWNTSPTIPCRKIRCPACGKEPFSLIEFWDAVIEFEYAGGKRGKDGILNPGNPNSVFAECECGKRWKLKNCTQIINLDVKK